MPQNVRNFWLEIDVDGRSTPIATGPQSKGGGFSLVIRQRENGGIITSARVSGRESQGYLILDVKDGQGNVHHHVVTMR